MNGWALAIETVRPGMIVSGVALGQHNLDPAAIEHSASRFIFCAPGGDRTPAERIAIKRYGPIEVRRGNEKMTEAILWHGYRPLHPNELVGLNRWIPSAAVLGICTADAVARDGRCAANM